MLLQLSIHHLALINDMTIDFEPGMNVMTGETGAGKSIVVDAVNLVLGERADRDLITNGEMKARVRRYSISRTTKRSRRCWAN